MPAQTRTKPKKMSNMGDGSAAAAAVHAICGLEDRSKESIPQRSDTIYMLAKTPFKCCHTMATRTHTKPKKTSKFSTNPRAKQRSMQSANQDWSRESVPQRADTIYMLAETSFKSCRTK
jgi:hypothetical protein